MRSPLSFSAVNRGGCCKPEAPVLYSRPGPSFKSNCTIGTAFASKRNGSMSAMCEQSKIQEFFEAVDRKCKGWIHFVGVGGCGLSALAMLALKQVVFPFYSLNPCLNPSNLLLFKNNNIM